MKNRHLIAGLACLSTMGCGAEAPVDEGSSSTQNPSADTGSNSEPSAAAPEVGGVERGARQLADRRFLPYGVSVPPGTSVDAPPEPHDELLHGPALENSHAEYNVAKREGYLVPEELKQARFDRALGRQLKSSDPYPGEGDRGFWVQAGTGIYAGSDVQSDLSIPNNAVGPSGTWIYSPTHMPDGGSCIEMVTVHRRLSTVSATEHFFGLWDWCSTSGGFTVLETMDATWRSKYARTFDGEDTYFSEVVKWTSTEWRGLLYNFTLGQWELKMSKSGTSQTGHSDGWTMWEEWFFPTGVCPSLPNIRARSVSVYNGSTWTPLSTSNSTDLFSGGNSCFTGGSPDYGFTVHTANSDWEAITL